MDVWKQVQLCLSLVMRRRVKGRDILEVTLLMQGLCQTETPQA